MATSSWDLSNPFDISLTYPIFNGAIWFGLGTAGQLSGAENEEEFYAT